MNDQHTGSGWTELPTLNRGLSPGSSFGSGHTWSSDISHVKHISHIDDISSMGNLDSRFRQVHLGPGDGADLSSSDSDDGNSDSASTNLGSTMSSVKVKPEAKSKLSEFCAYENRNKSLQIGKTYDEFFVFLWQFFTCKPAVDNRQQSSNDLAAGCLDDIVQNSSIAGNETETFERKLKPLLQGGTCVTVFTADKINDCSSFCTYSLKCGGTHNMNLLHIIETNQVSVVLPLCMKEEANWANLSKSMNNHIFTTILQEQAPQQAKTSNEAISIKLNERWIFLFCERKPSRYYNRTLTRTANVPYDLHNIWTLHWRSYFIVQNRNEGFFGCLYACIYGTPVKHTGDIVDNDKNAYHKLMHSNTQSKTVLTGYADLFKWTNHHSELWRQYLCEVVKKLGICITIIFEGQLQLPNTPVAFSAQMMTYGDETAQCRSRDEIFILKKFWRSDDVQYHQLIPNHEKTDWNDFWTKGKLIRFGNGDKRDIGKKYKHL